MTSRIIIEADGGSRGNPGPASYGALVRDAETGQVMAQRGETIGIATNNVAEYSGLIAGLELAREHAPDASEVEVRMDSKLVVEQMAGRWKIKHESMKPLARQAQQLAPPGVVWTWIPRERNQAADALANAALDDAAAGGTGRIGDLAGAGAGPSASAAKSPVASWRARSDARPTTVVLLRHGVTTSTERKLFCGSGGSDPGLTEAGRQQAEAAATWIERLGGIDAVVSSPLRRTQETAGSVARALSLEVQVEPGLAEASFGDWDGHSFAQIMQRWPTELEEWLGSTAVAPPGGETFDAVHARVSAARDRLVESYAGQTIVAVSHVTPIKLLVRLALDAPMQVIYKMELAPASITTIQWWPDGAASLRNFNIVPD
ncbi:bifunctional RNase H/acid phosphatase [Aeromicrobium sp. A1-2]|uniref:bifunctional RNase H/acid phosphatase n=1 Tax=Aeromicrobium sp. A1-2 TaxID=2107713 RepID=UPI000E517E1E|nr:bifunctional RNase H/acid phosphatase [Aeromicrobium sp. A1-2]AXT84616.1 bifunctional RNase H/acid phosphatase [Aeromicrobium sp. A1-2]